MIKYKFVNCNVQFFYVLCCCSLMKCAGVTTFMDDGDCFHDIGARCTVNGIAEFQQRTVMFTEQWLTIRCFQTMKPLNKAVHRSIGKCKHSKKNSILHVALR